jgi:polyprenyl-phospho-N-acetylgalactosaminyl synthase
MINQADTWFVIPAYNENQSLAAVVKSIDHLGYSVVVVDDHSADDTQKVALKSGAWVVRHPINLGQGAALQTGIKFAINKGAEAIVTFDADGQHQVSDAQFMLEQLSGGAVDVVLGSRFLRGVPDSMPTMRFFILKLAIIFTRVTSRLRVTDTHNGLRVFRASAASRLNLQQNRMAHASEILSQIRKLGLSYVEYPTDIKYTSYSISKGQKSSNFISIIFELLIGKFK